MLNKRYKHSGSLNEILDFLHRLENLHSHGVLLEGKLHDQCKKRTYNVLKNGNTWLSYIIDEPCTEDGMDGSMTYFDWAFKDLSSHWCRKNIKLTPVIANILYNELGYRSDSPKSEEINTFKEIVPLLEKDPKLGTMPWNEAIKFSYEDLYEYFKPAMEQMSSDLKDKINKEKFDSNSDYVIKLLETQEEGEKYAGFTGGMYGEGHKICYLTSISQWSNFTNGNKNTVYVCLKNGYQRVKAKPGENAPFDKYGLSMIFVIVDKNGKLVHSNVRWNHAYVGDWNMKHNDQEPRDVDKILNEFEISKIINVKFNEAFAGKGSVPLGEIMEKVETANNIYEVSDYFDEYPMMIGFNKYVVKYNGKCNILDMESRSLLFINFYDNISKYLGFDTVSITDGGKTTLYNFKNRTALIKKPLSGVKFISVYDQGKYAKVEKTSDNLVYIFDIGKNDFVINEGFLNVIDICADTAIVRDKDGFKSLIDATNGKKIGNQTYQKIDWVEMDSIVLLDMNGRYFIYNVFRKDFLSKEGYDRILCDKKEYTRGNLYDKKVKGRANWLIGGSYVTVSIGDLLYAQFKSGYLYPVTNSNVCGYEEASKYEDMAGELDKFMHNAPYPYNHKAYFEGLYDFWLNNNDTDGLRYLAEDYVNAKFPGLGDNEYDEMVVRYTQSARILAFNYHYVFEEMMKDEEEE